MSGLINGTTSKIRDSAIEYLSLLDEVKVINIGDKEYVVLNPKYKLN